ncbi:hypothetical protein NPIL_122421 [Nephila pilipes]|uniref:Uncharacterized protein n=1 Tax=Nephila pilipes TaxID=299642 RepID=A0A8X6P290_NEPPI|nr:hypothetical protein NPIL_122421 [Nephila pilipes]
MVVMKNVIELETMSNISHYKKKSDEEHFTQKKKNVIELPVGEVLLSTDGTILLLSEWGREINGRQLGTPFAPGSVKGLQPKKCPSYNKEKKELVSEAKPSPKIRNSPLNNQYHYEEEVKNFDSVIFSDKRIEHVSSLCPRLGKGITNTTSQLQRGDETVCVFMERLFL